MLTFYDWVYGIAQLAAGFLAIIAGVICLLMLRSSRASLLRAWRPLLFGLLFMITLQIIGGLRTFGVLPNTGFWKFSVHILVTAVLALLMGALVIQIQVNRGWLK